MKIITEGSVWFFDEDALMFTRFPKNGEGQARDHYSLSYERIGKPAPYVSIERGFYYGGDRIKVNAVDRDQCCYTGAILEVSE